MSPSPYAFGALAFFLILARSVLFPIDFSPGHDRCSRLGHRFLLSWLKKPAR
jgi:hypothetical protein